ncbi:MAG: DUF6261 family protein [Bacteroidota bacterium]
MSVKIFRLPFRTLWNSEYTLFVNQVVNIILRYTTEALHLAKAFGRVTFYLPELAKIKAQEQGSILSRQLQELDDERDALITAIPAQVSLMGRLNMPSLAPHIVILEHYFDTAGRDIAADTYNAETKRIDDLLADYDAKPEVQAAATSLNLGLFFEQLRVVNTQFAGLFMQRNKEDAALEKADSRAIRNEIDKTLNDFFKAFEFCSSEYEDVDYTAPANELNELISYYKTQLKARATRRHAGKDVSKEQPIGQITA